MDSGHDLGYLERDNKIQHFFRKEKKLWRATTAYVLKRIGAEKKNNLRNILTKRNVKENRSHIGIEKYAFQSQAMY